MNDIIFSGSNIFEKGEIMSEASKKSYEEASLQIITLSVTDIITTSDIGSGSNMDEDGWTGSKVW